MQAKYGTWEQPQPMVGESRAVSVPDPSPSEDNSELRSSLTLAWPPGIRSPWLRGAHFQSPLDWLPLPVRPTWALSAATLGLS